MPFADEFLSFFRSRGASEFGHLLGRVLKPAGDVLDGIGPAAGRISHELRMVEDETAQGVGRYLNEALPIESWESIAPEKRTQAAHYLSGWMNESQSAAALADSEISSMINSMRSTFADANNETLAAVDAFGNPVQVRNLFTGEYRPYEGITGDYFPLFVKRTKRDAILDPMNYAQEELERTITGSKLKELGLDANALLPDDQQQVIRDMASDAIDDFFRTGEANDVLNDKAMLDTLKPAYDTFQELHENMRELAIRKATNAGKPIPPEVDPILELFGSPDPKQQRAGIRMMREFLLRDAQNARRFGSIESSRALPLPISWYEDDPLRVAPVYLLRHQRRLAEMRHFGQNNEKILDENSGLLKQIAGESDREFAKRVFDRAMGLEPYNKSVKINNLLDIAFASQITKLGTAQISQMGQIMNVIMETGLGPTWQALSNLSRSKDIALKSGASLTRVMDIVREGLSDPLETSGARKFTEGFLKWTGFNKMDLVARHVGAGAGYAHGHNMLMKVIKDPGDLKALKELKRLVPGAKREEHLFDAVLDKIAQFRASGKEVSPEMVEQEFGDVLTNIARTASLNANFRQSILDTPLWSSSPLGRLMMMFRSFAYKQTLFMTRRAMEDYKAGNPRTLIALGAAAGLLGPMISALKSIPQGRFGEESGELGQAVEDIKQGNIGAAGLKAAENIAAVGGMGIFDSVLRALRRGELGFFEFVAGPLFTDMAKFVGATGEIGAGVSGYGEPYQTVSGIRKLGKATASHVPVIGGGISQAIRTATEDVVRAPSGAVLRPGGKQVLGMEEPPMQIGGMTLPSLPVLLGLEQSAFGKREELMDELKAAVHDMDRTAIRRVLEKAQASGVRISADSLNRLIRERVKKVKEEEASRS